MEEEEKNDYSDADADADADEGMYEADLNFGIDYYFDFEGLVI